MDITGIMSEKIKDAVREQFDDDTLRCCTAAALDAMDIECRVMEAVSNKISDFIDDMVDEIIDEEVTDWLDI